MTDDADLVEEHSHSVECVWCGRDHPFEMPEAITSAARNGRLTVFAGAGISTENSVVFPTSLYSEFKSVLKIDDDGASFPSVMTSYEESFGRRAMISEIVQRFDYVESFPSIEQHATRFHRELATIGCINTIITTNWDTAFENYCHARPFVVDDDYAYFDLPGRKVFKIHGSVMNVSTLVATESDYAEREALFATSAMGSTLKHLLATQVVIFVGFSLADPDFQSIYRALLSGLGKARPPAYVVNPYGSDLAESLGLRVIKTDGTNFLRQLKIELRREDVLLSDTVLRRARALGEAARVEQNRILEGDWRSHPAMVYSVAYLDGIRDCTGRAGALGDAGEYTYVPHLSHMVHHYDKLMEVAVERERWWDAAYIRGYLNSVVSFFVSDDEFCSIELGESFSDSFYPGVEEEPGDPDADSDSENLPDAITDDRDWDSSFLEDLFEDQDLDQLRRAYDESSCTSKESIEAEMQKILENLPDGMIYRHTAFLDGVIDAKVPHPLI